MCESGATVGYQFHGLHYNIRKTDLVKYSSLPSEDWIDELINAGQHHASMAQAEIDVFLAAVDGRYSMRDSAGDMGTADCCSILYLATRWGFDGLRDIALSRLEALADPVVKLMSARVCSVTHWYIPAYTSLCLRDEPLSVDEARKLEPEDMMRIFHAREAIFRERLAATEVAVASHFSRIMNPPVDDLGPLPTLSSLAHVSEPENSVENEITPGLEQPSSDHRLSVSPSAALASGASHDGDSPVDRSTALYIAQKPDDAVQLVTPANCKAITRRLLRIPGYLSGTAATPAVYEDRATAIAVAAMRRGVRDHEFIPAGVHLVCTLVRLQPAVEHRLASELRCLDEHFKGFLLDDAELPPGDAGSIMPRASSAAYGVAIKNGKAFISWLLEQGLFREYAWMRQSPLSQTHSCTVASSPPPDLPEGRKPQPDYTGAGHDYPPITSPARIRERASGPTIDASSVAAPALVVSLPDSAASDAEAALGMFLEDKYDRAIQLVSPVNVDTITSRLASASDFLTGPMEEKKQRKRYKKRTGAIVLAAMRRHAYDPAFLSAGSQLVVAVLRICPDAEMRVASSLQSLEQRFRDFLLSGGTVVPRIDTGCLVPRESTTSYRAGMKNSQAFVTALLGHGIFRGPKWHKRLRFLTLSAYDSDPSDEEHVAVESSLGQPSGSERPAGVVDFDDEWSPNSGSASADAAIAAILAKDYDLGVTYLTPDNASAIWSALSESWPSDQSQPGRLLATAVLRRAFRDPDFAFVPAGTTLLSGITSAAPAIGKQMVGKFHAVLTRWKRFEASNGDCSAIKADPGCFMSDGPPSSIEPEVYQERIERGKKVIRALAKEKAFIGCEMGLQSVMIHMQQWHRKRAVDTGVDAVDMNGQRDCMS
ncbi:unnamed protein product [Peniophora sp. CBMAI 1063]|nr:unnamed protein product [Peniophora sp. CBMAI 1063]